MANVFAGEAFAFKNVAKVSCAVLANDFDPAPISIRDSFDGSRDFIVETWPSTMGWELVGGFVEWGIALFAMVMAIGSGVAIFAGERFFGSLFVDDKAFKGSQFAKIYWFVHDALGNSSVFSAGTTIS
jgi:hypothetical protein